MQLYQVDAFASRVFAGNPAAVCPLDSWLPEDMMQAIATENNLSETAFFVPEGDGYRIRWFTPVAEVDLCGHATLASAFVILFLLQPAATAVKFISRSGPLSVARDGDLLTMDFPAQPPHATEAPGSLIDGLGQRPNQVLAADDLLAVFDTEETIRRIEPNFDILKKVQARGIIVSAPGRDVDFVSRFFAPRYGVNEDPVTGSTHCMLTPYWAERLGKTHLRARQLSSRGGELECRLSGERVLISGRAVLYLVGEIYV